MRAALLRPSAHEENLTGAASAPSLARDRSRVALRGLRRSRRPARAPAPEVVVAPVEKQDVEIYSEWVGTTAGFVNAEIFPKIQGYLLKQTYRTAALVKEGDLLFEIDPRQFQATLDEANGQLARARAALEKHALDVARYTPLAAQGAVSQQELDNAVQAPRGERRAGRLDARQPSSRRASTCSGPR